MSREYDQLAWVDYPETLTPISAANLNRMENGIANLYTDRNKMENNIAYVEEGETATRHYFINSYLMLNGIFYKTTSEINIGDILDPTLAGNIEHVDISSQFGSGGGGSTGCVELTQAQYDALSEEAKMLDVIYLITDSPDNYLDEVFGDFATVEYTDTASKAYAVGDYLVYDSKFYRVTSAIAQGDTIVPDTNVVKTTVGEEFRKRGKVMESSSVQAFLTDLGDLSNGGFRFYFIPWRSINTQDGLDTQNTFVFGTRNYAVINAIAINLLGKMYSIEAGSTVWAPFAINKKKTYSSFSYVSSKINLRNCLIVEYYNICIVSCQFDITSDIPNGEIMFTLPSGCPASIINTHHVAGSSTGSFGFRVDTNRNIVGESSPSIAKVGNWAGFTVIYPII